MEPDMAHAKTASDLGNAGSEGSTRSDYQMPWLPVRVPERMGNVAFWLGMTGAVVAGAVELPVAALVAAGVVVVRHRSNAR
jgi:hypothetical protein